MPDPMNRHHERERGQMLVVMTFGLVAMLAMTGLIVDGGYAFTQQRAVQNGTDAAANAGAVVLAERLDGAVSKNDGDVLTAVNGALTANHVATATAYYTDVIGRTLRSDGTPSAGLGDAVVVGATGAIPPCVDPTTCVAAKASGVLVLGSKAVNTFVSRVIGVNTIGVGTRSTAVSGWIEDVCSASAGCGVLPVTIPITTVTCDGTNQAVPDPSGTKYSISGGQYVIPLCANGPGNVGWLDWTPPSGGTSELIDSITTLNNPELYVPGWYYVTATGNVNSSSVQDALSGWIGKGPILIPQFDATCNIQPIGNEMGDCPPGNVGGTGTNQWYHLGQFAALDLTGVYITGSNAICNTGNGATSCLVGSFDHFLPPNTKVQAGQAAISGTALVGVQLIK